MMDKSMSILNRIEARYFDGDTPRADLTDDELKQAAADVREFVAATYEALQPIVRGMCQVVEALAEWVGEFDETYPGLLDAYREEQGE